MTTKPATFTDKFGDMYVVIANRAPNKGDLYVSELQDKTVVKSQIDFPGITPRNIVIPVGEIVTDEPVDIPFISVEDTHPKNHPLARFVKGVTYQQSGRATAALVTVVLPADGATASCTGLGLSVCRAEDRFSMSGGRKMAVLRALDNIAANV